MHAPSALSLNSGSRVAVVGGGPAGSLFAYFLLDLARRADKDLQVDIYEPRDFAASGPAGCNMCAGVISESLVQTLATEGVLLPPSVVQRGIDSYTLHMDLRTVHIRTPLHEKRIAVVHRGAGPRGLKVASWDSFDGFLLGLAISKGARLVRLRVDAFSQQAGRPQIRVGDELPQSYDLLAMATGVNTATPKLLEGLMPGFRPPRTTRAYICELNLGQEALDAFLGNSMHVFLLNLPRLEFAALVPKGEYATLCMMGEEIDPPLVQSLLDAPEVRACLPPDWRAPQDLCHCAPRINVGGADPSFTDRIVFLGDCGVTRLYKDGIGAAYRAAKAAAVTALFDGVAASDFRRRYGAFCRATTNDNRIGRLIFAVARQIQALPPARHAVMRMIAREQNTPGRHPHMSMVMWDLFTGSAPYREVFLRTLHPAFLGRLAWEMLSGLWTPSGRDKIEEAGMRTGALGRTYADGTIIFREGDAGDCMYVVQAGQVEVLHERNGKEILLTTLGEGDIFGEIAIFQRQVRTATVRALGQARLITVDKQTFMRRVHEDPSLAYRILQRMSDRIRELSTELAQLKARDDVSDGR